MQIPRDALALGDLGEMLDLLLREQQALVGGHSQRAEEIAGADGGGEEGQDPPGPGIQMQQDAFRR